MEQTENIFFEEIQQFRRKVHIAIALGFSMLFWGVASFLFFMRTIFLEDVVSVQEVLPGVLLFGLLLPWFLYAAKLIVEVRADGVYFRFFPFHCKMRKIPLSALISYEPKPCNPLPDVGGFGFGRFPKTRVYNICGTTGVRLELSDGKGIIFGSQRPKEFIEAISLVKKQQVVS